jgi:hypothetical protein
VTEALASQVLGWRSAPGRFLTTGKSWLPKSRFRPFDRLEHAFLLLDKASGRYMLSCAHGSPSFSASVTVGKRTGKAQGEAKARTITQAIARALGMEV